MRESRRNKFQRMRPQWQTAITEIENYRQTRKIVQNRQSLELYIYLCGRAHRFGLLKTLLKSVKDRFGWANIHSLHPVLHSPASSPTKNMCRCHETTMFQSNRGKYALDLRCSGTLSDIMLSCFIFKGVE